MPFKHNLSVYTDDEAMGNALSALVSGDSTSANRVGCIANGLLDFLS